MLWHKAEWCPLQFVVFVDEYNAEIQAESNSLPVLRPGQALYVDK